MSNQTQWWNSGWDAPEMKPENNGPGTKGSTFRWFLKNGEEKPILFLTDEAKFIYWEHQVKANGSFHNYVTCLSHLQDKNSTETPKCCSHFEKQPYPAAAFTVVDIEGFVDKNGNKHELVKKLLIAKPRTFEMLTRQYKRRQERDGKGLRGCIFTVGRSEDKKSPSVGDNFDFEERINDLTTVMEDPSEFDYPELLAPDPARVDELIKAVQNEPSSGDASQSVPK